MNTPLIKSRAPVWQVALIVMATGSWRPPDEAHHIGQAAMVADEYLVYSTLLAEIKTNLCGLFIHSPTATHQP
jgi:hypothetical protein